MVSIFRLLAAHLIALPLLAQSTETRMESGATATLENIHTFSAYATETIFGDTIRGVGYAQVGTSHSTVVERTKPENSPDGNAGTVASESSR